MSTSSRRSRTLVASLTLLAGVGASVSIGSGSIGAAETTPTTLGGIPTAPPPQTVVVPPMGTDVAMPDGTTEACSAAASTITDSIPVLLDGRKLSETTDLATAKSGVSKLLATVKGVGESLGKAVTAASQGATGDIAAQAADYGTKAGQLVTSIDETAAKVEGTETMEALGTLLNSAAFAQPENQVNMWSDQFAALRNHLGSSTECARMLVALGKSRATNGCAAATDAGVIAKQADAAVRALSTSASADEVRTALLAALEPGKSLAGERHDIAEAMLALANLPKINESVLAAEAKLFLERSTQIRSEIDEAVTKVKAAATVEEIVASTKPLEDNGNTLNLAGPEFPTMRLALAELETCKAMIDTLDVPGLDGSSTTVANGSETSTTTA